jgi:hypothetical protein
MKRLRQTLGEIRSVKTKDSVSNINKLILDIKHRNFTLQQFNELCDIEQLYRNTFLEIYRTVDKLVDPWTLKMRSKPLVSVQNKI